MIDEEAGELHRPRPPLSNWGRWGREDELGASNLVTDEKRLAALSIPRKGRVLHLSYLLGAAESPTRQQPLHLMNHPDAESVTKKGYTFATDYIGLQVHGSSTHIDALGHIFYDDQMYNGFEAADAFRANGLARLGIDRAPPLITRGLILDVAGVRGRDRLDSHYEITVEDLEASLQGLKCQIEPGDAILIRTGWAITFAEDPSRFVSEAPGIGLAAAEWLARQDPLGIGSDTSGVEVRPRASEMSHPVHRLLLRDCGIYLMELLSLDILAADCDTPFLFVGLPLRIAGGTGSPLAAVAIY